VGFCFDKNGRLDITEGHGAFHGIAFQRDTVSFDVGGGGSDDNKLYLKESFVIENVGYDPFARSEQHNRKALVRIASLMNVIDQAAACLDHINLCYNALKTDGKAYFRIWPGGGTRIGKRINTGFQINCGAAHFYQKFRICLEISMSN
jgi:hypothetical protein